MPAAKSNKQKLAKYVSTLVYLDEPQVVLLDVGDDNRVVGVAIEKEGYSFPFLGAEISVSQWKRYLREFVDLRYLFLVPKYKRWYIFDLADHNDNNEIPIMRAGAEDSRNDKYLPTQGFWARSHTEEEPSARLVGIHDQTFKIDGTWDPSDISHFFGRINDLYSFFLGIEKFESDNATNEQRRTLVETFTDNSLHSGFNYVNFYGDLKGLVGFDERLAMPSIVKQSPGHVIVAGVSSTLNQVDEALEIYNDHQSDLKEQYNDLYKYLSRMKLLRHEGERLERNDPISQEIKKKNAPFARTLNLDIAILNKLTVNNALLIAKILLAHYRRLERYHLFFVEGRVKREDEFLHHRIKA